MTSRGVEDDSYLDRIVESISRYGMQGPVLTILEAGKPLSFIVGQLIWIIQPTLSLVVGSEDIKRTALLLEDGRALDQLIDRLESKNKA